MTGIMLAVLSGGKGTSGYTVTAGYSVSYPQGAVYERYGFIVGQIGTISPTNASFSGTSFVSLVFFVINGSTQTLALSINGTIAQNAFTTMFIGATPFTSASASYSTGGGTTSWVWTTGTNLFPSVGSNYNVTFS